MAVVPTPPRPTARNEDCGIRAEYFGQVSGFPGLACSGGVNESEDKTSSFVLHRLLRRGKDHRWGRIVFVLPSYEFRQCYAESQLETLRYMHVYCE